MKKILMPLALVLLFCASLSSCKKDSDSKSKIEYLTKAGWKQVNGEIGVGGTFAVDPDWTATDACDKDDIITFFTNKTYEFTEGASKCDPTDDNLIDSGDWSFSADEKMIIIDGESATINKLDDNTLVVTYDDSGFSYRVTFNH